MVSPLFSRWIILAAIFVGLPLRSLSAHPIHMSYTETRHYAGTQELEISLRVYANDFSAAAARHAHVRLGADSLIDLRSALSYIKENFAIVDGANQLISLVPCGVTRAQDMLRFCFKARVTQGMSGIGIRNSIMTDLFSDQVNVVQSVSEKGRTSRLFVRGDGPKRLD